MKDVSVTRVVANRVRNLRVQRRWSARQLAEECAQAGAASLTRNTVAKIESGHRKFVTADELAALARALNVSPAALLPGPASPLPWQTGAVAGALDPAVRAPRTLPADAASFTGRPAELVQLMRADPGEAPGGELCLHVIGGMAGVGKTALAVHAAHQLAPRFPDGQMFLALHGHTRGRGAVEPADALARLLRSLGFAAQHIPAELEDRAGLWRDQMAGRRALLVLDDATGSEQVRPLLPGSSGTIVLVTSRRRLAALPGAVPITLDVLPAEQAAQLFARLAGRADLLPGDDAVGRMVSRCGQLPLAVSLLAARFRHHPAWTAADLAAAVESAPGPLDQLAAESESVAAAFAASYHRLPPDQQRLFCLLSRAPGDDADAQVAAAAAGTDVATAARLLDELFSYHLITEWSRGRYRLHTLVREYARTLAT